MIKKILYIFIPVLAVLLMSHNTDAISFDFSNYNIRRRFDTTALSCNVNLSYTSSGNSFCRFPAQSSPQLLLKNINTQNSVHLYSGEIIEFYYVIYNNLNYSVDSGVVFLNDISNQDSNLITLNFELVDDYSNMNFTVVNNSGQTISDFWSKNAIAKVYRITQYAVEEGDYYIGMGSSSTSVNRFVTEWYQLSDSTLTFSLRNFIVYARTDTKVNQEQSQATQNAADNSATAGSNSSSNVTSGTSSLLSVIGAGIGAITAASPSSCIINGNMGHLDVGTVDLCATPVPDFMQVIGSIIAVLVVLPLVIILFSRFISIIRSFQT